MLSTPDVPSIVAAATIWRATEEPNINKLREIALEHAMSTPHMGIDVVCDLLKTLNPTDYGIVHIVFLTQPRVFPSPECIELLVNSIMASHVLLEPELFIRLMKSYARSAPHPDNLVSTLVLAGKLLSINDNVTFVIPIHRLILRFVLLTREYETGHRLLLENSNRYPQVEAYYSSKEFLEYYYYAGLIFLTTKEYSRAIRAFETVLCVPTQALSSIQVEAYKKYLFACLIVYGDVKPIPKNAAFSVSRAINSAIGEQYQALADVRRPDPKTLYSIISAIGTLEAEGNIGLSKQALEVLPKFLLKSFTKTHITATLDNIAQTCGLNSVDAVEATLFKMVSDGDLRARIDHQLGTVTFDSTTPRVSTAETVCRTFYKARTVWKQLENTENELLASINSTEKFLNMPK